MRGTCFSFPTCRWKNITSGNFQSFLDFRNANTVLIEDSAAQKKEWRVSISPAEKFQVEQDLTNFLNSSAQLFGVSTKMNPQHMITSPMLQKWETYFGLEYRWCTQLQMNCILFSMLCCNEDNIFSENLPTSSDLRESLSDKQQSRILEEHNVNYQDAQLFSIFLCILMRR